MASKFERITPDKARIPNSGTINVAMSAAIPNQILLQKKIWL
jgi:hypothetical protein